MSWIQKFFTAILPGSWAKSMEEESRQWCIRCLNCGFEQSYWDMGGIRWKAKGSPRTLQKCSNCGKTSSHETYKKDLTPSANH